MPRPGPTAPPGPAKARVYGPQPVGVWAADILSNIGAPHTQNNVNNIAAWQACESGQTGGIDDTVRINNLFNTEQQSQAGNGYVPGTQVPTFPNYNTGLWATLMTMKIPGLRGIAAALRADASRQDFAAAVSAAGWGTSGACVAASRASAGIVAGTGLRPAGPISGFAGGGEPGGGGGVSLAGCVPGASLIYLAHAMLVNRRR